ncbi:MAG: PD-(D/E)XK nuclease family protein [Planctomycetia bacterium]|nr:PD-(D/E)XK nuclease family protein [Planctomycetia bacterium]
MSRPHWSYSQIACFQRCPLQYYFRYIAGIPRTTIPANMVLGTAVHAGLATYHRAIMHEHEIPFSKVETTYLDSWQTQADNNLIEYTPKHTREELQELGLTLLRQYAAEEPPTNVRSVEKPLYVPLQTSTGYILEKPLLTIADLITDSDDGLVVNEFKTSSRTYSNMEVEQSLQASCYIHAGEDTWALPTSVRFIIFVKTKQPKIQRLDTIRDANNSTRVGDIVQGIERAIRVDAFYPNESPMNCTSCSYRQPCREWGKQEATKLELLQFSTNGCH